MEFIVVLGLVLLFTSFSDFFDDLLLKFDIEFVVDELSSFDNISFLSEISSWIDDSVFNEVSLDWICNFLFDDLIRNYNLKDIDVIIDGKYEQDLYNPTLKYRGSSNQRVIDVNKSLKKKKIMLYEGVE